MKTTSSLLLLLAALASCRAETLLGQPSTNIMDDFSLLMLGGSRPSADLGIEAMVQSMVSELRVANIDDEQSESTVVASRLPSPDPTGNLTELVMEQPEEVADRLQSNKWSYVVLEEDREVPGYFPPDDNDSREDMWAVSVATINRLVASIQERGAVTVLLQTPAYATKVDNYNKDMYTSFQKMQEYITDGYEYYHREILEVNPTARVKIAPCGNAYARIYDDLAKPLEEKSPFVRLYESDRRTPSALGNYLCACVLFQTLTGRDVRQVSYYAPIDDGTVDAMELKILREAAYNTVKEYEQPKKSAKRYRPASEKHSVSYLSIGNFILAILLGGGVLYGWVAWKWYDAASTVNDMTNQGGYQLLPSSGMVMELIEKQGQPDEPQWINPV